VRSVGLGESAADRCEEEREGNADLLRLFALFIIHRRRGNNLKQSKQDRCLGVVRKKPNRGLVCFGYVVSWSGNGGWHCGFCRHLRGVCKICLECLTSLFPSRPTGDVPHFQQVSCVCERGLLFQPKPAEFVTWPGSCWSYGPC
jgi:hypothetical protein